MNARADALERLNAALNEPNAPAPDADGVVWIARDDARWHAGDRAALTLDRANLNAIQRTAPALMTRGGRAAYVDPNEADAETLNAAARTLSQLNAHPVLDDRAYADAEYDAYADALETIARDAAYHADAYLDETTPEPIADAARDAIADALTVWHVFETTPERYTAPDGVVYDADAIADAAVSVMLRAATYEQSGDGDHRIIYPNAPAPLNATRYRNAAPVMPYRNETDAARALYDAWTDALERWTA